MFQKKIVFHPLKISCLAKHNYLNRHFKDQFYYNLNSHLTFFIYMSSQKNIYILKVISSVNGSKEINKM